MKIQVYVNVASTLKVHLVNGRDVEVMDCIIHRQTNAIVLREDTLERIVIYVNKHLLEEPTCVYQP